MKQINDGKLYCLPFWRSITNQPARPPSGRITHLFPRIFMCFAFQGFSGNPRERFRSFSVTN
ncbi:MAG: hypothetical protein LBK82_10000 [Planctomycetaceae bacterium]|nr:hypothetical protein [Planctomycetaceae bacterium]